MVDCDKCVIEVIFTDEEVEHFKKEMGEENFYTLADDANYYAYALREYLKSNSLKLSIFRVLIHITQGLYFQMQILILQSLSGSMSIIYTKRVKNLINL